MKSKIRIRLDKAISSREPSLLKSPLRNVLKHLCRKAPPKFTEDVWLADELTDDQFLELQMWCVAHANPPWATGMSMIEVAQEIIVAALENGNI